VSKNMAVSPGTLRIAVDREPGCAVCRLSGDLDAASAARVRAVLGEQLDEGCDAVIDLSGLGFIDSSGLGVLVGALKRFQAAGHTLTLRSPTSSLQRVLAMTGLADAFTVET
jgi:anti-sigma B factor antagonist